MNMERMMNYNESIIDRAIDAMYAQQTQKDITKYDPDFETFKHQGDAVWVLVEELTQTKKRVEINDERVMNALAYLCRENNIKSCEIENGLMF